MESVLISTKRLTTVSEDYTLNTVHAVLPSKTVFESATDFKLCGGLGVIKLHV